MRIILIGVFTAGLGLAGFAVHMAQGYVGTYRTALAQERAARERMVETTDIFVAARAIRYGERLRKEDVRPVRWPANAVPVGAFQDPALLFPEGGEPRTVLRAMEDGEAILAVKVTEPGRDAGVSSRLSTGMRAFAVRVDVASGVSGFLRPEDRVDVYWSGRAGNGDITELIQTGVRIVAIDQSADQDHTSPTVARTVTVEADPQQVARLAQAQSTGRLSLSLVGASDDTLAVAQKVDQSTLLGLREEQVVEVEPRRECTIRMRRGGEVITTPIPCAD